MQEEFYIYDKINQVYRAAGELEGVRPASNTINRRRKDRVRAFRAKLHFDIIKMLGGKAVKKSNGRLFDKLCKGIANRQNI